MMCAHPFALNIPSRVPRWGLLWLTLMLLSACDYPPVIKSQPQQPSQPLLTRFVGHPPLAPTAYTAPQTSMAMQSISGTELQPIEIALPEVSETENTILTPQELEDHLETYQQKHTASALNLSDQSEAKAASSDNTSNSTGIVHLDLGQLSEDGNAENALSTASASAPAIMPAEPEPGNIDLENIQDLHQIRIQLMAESP